MYLLAEVTLGGPPDVDQTDKVVLRGVGRHDVMGPIGRRVVDDDPDAGSHYLCDHRTQPLLDERLLVVGGRHHYERACGERRRGLRHRQTVSLIPWSVEAAAILPSGHVVQEWTKRPFVHAGEELRVAKHEGQCGG